MDGDEQNINQEFNNSITNRPINNHYYINEETHKKKSILKIILIFFFGLVFIILISSLLINFYMNYNIKKNFQLLDEINLLVFKCIEYCTFKESTYNLDKYYVYSEECMFACESENINDLRKKDSIRRKRFEKTIGMSDFLTAIYKNKFGKVYNQRQEASGDYFINDCLLRIHVDGNKSCLVDYIKVLEKDLNVEFTEPIWEEIKINILNVTCTEEEIKIKVNLDKGYIEKLRIYIDIKGETHELTEIEGPFYIGLNEILVEKKDLKEIKGYTGNFVKVALFYMKDGNAISILPGFIEC